MPNKNISYLFGFEKQKLQQWFLYWILLVSGFIVLTFLITSTWIGISVRDQCQVAKGKYQGDCVEVLMQTVDDDNNSLRDRNYAIWSLGQIGDDRALPIIEKYYTGNIPDREPYDETLSQYEMKKTIKLLNGGSNWTHIVWKLSERE